MFTDFPNESKLASFFGIVPSNRDSSSITRRGHMSKEGARATIPQAMKNVLQ